MVIAKPFPAACAFAWSHCYDLSSPAALQFHDAHLHAHLEPWALACAHLSSAQTRSSLLVSLAHYLSCLLVRISPVFTHLHQPVRCQIGRLITVYFSVVGHPSQTRFKRAHHLWNTILRLCQLLGRAVLQDSRNERDTGCGIHYGHCFVRASHSSRPVVNSHPQSAAEQTRHTSRLVWGS